MCVLTNDYTRFNPNSAAVFNRALGPLLARLFRSIIHAPATAYSTRFTPDRVVVVAVVAVVDFLASARFAHLDNMFIYNVCTYDERTRFVCTFHRPTQVCSRISQVYVPIYYVYCILYTEFCRRHRR